MPRPKWGTVRQLPSGNWQARYPYKGERLYAPQTWAADQMQAAWDWLDAKKREIADGEHVDPHDGKMLFKDYAEVWKTSTAARKLRQSSRNRDFGYLDRYIIPRFGQVALADITFEMVDEWIVELGDSGGKDGRGLAPSTVLLAGIVLNKVLKRAIKSHHIKHNPCADVTLPKAGKKPMNIITPPEIDRLALGMDPRYRAFPVFACYSGFRVSECFGLKWRNVHFTDSYVEVATTTIETDGAVLTGQPTKSSAGRRNVPLSAKARVALLEHKERFGGGPDDYVFRAPKGGPVRLANFRNRYWHRAVTAAGIDAGFAIHDQRHTAVSLWIAAGINVKEVSEFAGHESVSFTLKTYGHLYPSSGEAFILKLDAATALALGSDEGTPTGHEGSDELADVIPIGKKQALISDAIGGASKNRTCDLSIISAAL